MTGFQRGGEDGDLFQGTAHYYAAFRRPYPPPVVAYLVDTFALRGRGRLLDAGCGTGQVFSVLAKYFKETYAFDQDAEMVALAKHSTLESNLVNVHVHTMKAEDITPRLGFFSLAVFGASFHWMDRERVAELVYDILEPLGHIVILAPSTLHAGDGPLERAIKETVTEFLGPQRRAGGGAYLPGERHAQALSKTRFGTPNTVDMYVEEKWDIDQVIGWVYSTSFASKALLGSDSDSFEANLRARLQGLAPSGVFSRNTDYTVIWATREQIAQSVTVRSPDGRNLEL